MTWSFHNHMGYSTWVARITGTDTKFGFAQEFLCGQRSSSKSGATGDFTVEVSVPGLYRVGGNKHDNGFRLTQIREDKLVWFVVDITRAKKIAELLQGGVAFEDARKQSKEAKV